MKITAEEIADDVQQTFEGIPNSYRQILEDRIINHARQKCEKQVRRCRNIYSANRHKTPIGIKKAIEKSLITEFE